jgi:hypothetical protein
MRIENIEKGFDDLWKIVVDLQVNASGKKRERLYQPFNVRILGPSRPKQQMLRNRRILFGKLRTHCAKKR